MKTVLIVTSAILLAARVQGSAIPMWEYLSKDEKMSYLYSMFANQVEDFCKSSPMHDCNRQLLKHGIAKLKDMPEDHLDAMDPYQRGANNIIWDSMMEGHPAPLKATTPRRVQPNSYEDSSASLLDNQEPELAASAKIDNVYKVLPPRNFVNQYYRVASGTPQYYEPHKGAYTRYQEQYTTRRPVVEGPMVVMVYPDGRPVYGNGQQRLPQDEDLRQYRMSKIRLPNFN